MNTQTSVNKDKFVKVVYLKCGKSTKWKSSGIIKKDDGTLSEFLEDMKVMFGWARVSVEPVYEK